MEKELLMRTISVLAVLLGATAALAHMQAKVVTQNEYKVGGYFVGVPCVLGANGMERVIEIELDSGERKMFDESVSHVKELVAWVEKNWAA